MKLIFVVTLIFQAAIVVGQSAVKSSELQKVMPCHGSKEAHEFDFWIGEWEVKNASGAIAGSSSITQILDECVIFESWTSAPPNLYSGKSFNLFNSITGKWQQTWVDDKGGVTEYINGVYTDNKMILVTKPDKNNKMLRMTFFNMNPDLVRQFGETSADGGITWAPSFNLFYNRIK